MVDIYEPKLSGALQKGHHLSVWGDVAVGAVGDGAIGNRDRFDALGVTLHG